jgi:hypothetical protein
MDALARAPALMRVLVCLAWKHSPAGYADSEWDFSNFCVPGYHSPLLITSKQNVDYEQTKSLATELVADSRV